DAHVAERRSRQEHAQGPAGRPTRGDFIPAAPHRGKPDHSWRGPRHWRSESRRRRARSDVRPRDRAQGPSAVGAGQGAVADDRLRNQTADRHARHVENGSEGHCDLRSGALVADDVDIGSMLTHTGSRKEKAMRSTLRFVVAMTATLTLSSPAAAQQAAERGGAGSDSSSAVPKATVVDDAAKTSEEENESSWSKGRPITMQYYRALDKRGINVFETTKDPGVKFEGLKLDFSAAFTSQLQNLSHSNTARPNMVSGVNVNQLMGIGFGFNNPTANLYLNTQLAPGIRVALTSYLSSRHHNETWVKDGYIQIDQSPID